MRSFAVFLFPLRWQPHSTGYISGFVGRLFRDWCRNRCCRFNFGICILNINTNAKCLFNEKANKKIKILYLTEPYFKKLNSNYAEALGIYGKKWWSFPPFYSLIICLL
jgi:HAE1 family hydrophobic/amphiphilic exporter-1/multidrug efflux pump